MTAPTDHLTARRGHASGPSLLRTGAARLASALTTMAVVALVVLACLLLVVAVASRLSPEGRFTVFGHPVMTVLSGSMSPAIDTGDMVIDDPVAPERAGSLQVGQVISFYDAPGSDVVITHRIVEIDTSGTEVAYRTKGDANTGVGPDPRPASTVIGVVHTTVPRAGYILSALQRPLVLCLFLISIVLAFAAGPLFRLAREDEPEPHLPDETTGEGPWQ